jgi:sterol desaturase/sphingolipid hydroxylase (fatty acid hydroxylase superfamily)
MGSPGLPCREGCEDTMGFWDTLVENLKPIAGILSRIFIEYPSYATPLWAVVAVPFAAILCFALMRARHIRQVTRYPYRKVFKLLVSPRYLSHPSHRLDLILLAGNCGLFTIFIAKSVVSVAAVHALFHTSLVSTFGAMTPTTLDPRIVGLTWSVALILAYELAYWLDHYLSHKIPFLWEFHKVHHSAEVLSPLTNFRVHPVDSIVFINIVSVVMGMTTAVLTFGFGAGRIKIEMWGIMTVVGIVFAIGAQMQHSHIWLPIRGWLGRVILSPAHHQIHHSVLVEHHDKNFGSVIGLYDWLFGTLVIPPKRRPHLVFGVDTIANPKHDLHEGLLKPFIDAAKHVTPARGQADGKSTAPAVA